MAYVLRRDPSPPRHDASLASAVHAALRPFHPDPALLPALPSPPPPAEADGMYHKEKHDKHGSQLEINVDSDTLCLRGTGVDVDAALLSGNVILNLSEPTSIKEITLQFRGKARLPVSPAESITLSSSTQLTYIVCSHEWSFLEGDRHHAHMLKAGRHLFPFQLQIGGSLPSSLFTTALGGASVQYKLRAHVVRGGFGLTHRDMTALQPITIIRGFGHEALEYQQTLEIENTWPEKLMYSIMIPHKAWAAGERLSAVVKFCPLIKGVRVINVTTTLNETAKIYARAGMQESTRVIATTKHDIVDGAAVCIDEQLHRFRVPLLHGTPARASHSTMTSGANTPAHGPTHQANGSGTYFPHASTSSSPRQESPTEASAEFPPLTTTTSNSSSSSSGESQALHIARPGPSSQPVASTSTAVALGSTSSPPSEEAEEEPSSDVITTLQITVPLHATPSHALEPLHVSHRIRWSILISNPDGHTSELRCSLPIHVLDHRLLEEARSATLATRRLLLGRNDVEGGQAVLGPDDTQDDPDTLPSYPSHVRDRVANAYLPNSATMRVANAWVVNGVSPTIPTAQRRSTDSSGISSPANFETWQVNHNGDARAHLPPEPHAGATEPLEWVNTELLLSLGREAPEAPIAVTPQPRPSPPSQTPPESGSHHTSRHGSRIPSTRGSRANSPERAGSSDSHTHSRAHSQHGHGPDTYVHGHSTASRNVHGLFSIAMKPFTSLGTTFSLGSRSASHASLQALAAAAAAGAPGAPAPEPVPMTSREMLHHAFTQVPDYDMASRGFLGGGITPLTSLRDLPSYSEAVGGAPVAERSASDGDLAAMFAAARVRDGAERPRMPRMRTATVSP